MEDSSNSDDLISNRRSKRSCRLSIQKPVPSVETKEIEEPVVEEIVEEEDPPETFQPGDICWVRIPGNPWWPALVYGSYYEEYMYTKVSNPPRRPKKRLYFLYFFGPDFEYTWTNATALIPFLGLEEFIQQAQTAMEKATSRSQQEAISNRYELKVAANKRTDWDKAIREADEALQFPREKRAENFAEILKNILDAAEKNKASKKRKSSAPPRKSKKSLTPPPNEPSNRSSVKRQKTKSTIEPVPTDLLRVGLPTLTTREEKRLVNELLAHPKHNELTLIEALSGTCKSVMSMVKENSHYDMTCIQIEWFYDFLIKHPEIICKYAHWLDGDIKPVMDDPIDLKKCQLKNLIQKQSS